MRALLPTAAFLLIAWILLAIVWKVAGFVVHLLLFAAVLAALAYVARRALPSRRITVRRDRAR